MTTVAPEALARMTGLFEAAGITRAPIWHRDDPGADTTARHVWSIVCQSVQTTQEIADALPPERVARLAETPDGRPDEIAVTIGSYERSADQRPQFVSWVADACRKVPAGYVPVRIVKGAVVKASVMGPAELRSLRESVGYSIEDLTRELSVSRSIVQKWEAGNAPIPPGVAAAVEALQDAYQDALDIALAAGGTVVTVPRTDEASWAATGRPARWHRQIAAEVRLEHGARIEWMAP